MARKKTTDPNVQRQTGQISLDLDDYIVRFTGNWNRPTWLEADAWRKVVDMQPVCVDCRETIISQILSFEFKLDARDSQQRDELKETIRYYTGLLEDSGELDYVGLTEWILSDYLDLPMGGVVEVGRDSDSETGKVQWILPLDGATCFPYPNYDYPVGQAIPQSPIEKVYFPRHSVNRMFMSPRRDIRRNGWGMAPPEKIYMAIEMLNRGDRYYAQLLLDTPEAGILDLGDMARDSAKEWIKSWREMLAGIDPFKIPVLYEHEKAATFIPFVKSPTEIMFDKALLKYASLVTSGYGLSLSDINVPQVSSGGDTLAGSIRGERKTRRTGIARTKRSFIAFWNRILPPEIQFKFIDLDEEVSVALSRARLANATAQQIMIQSRTFSNKEMRLQTLADGLISIPIPEEPPEEDLIPEPQPFTNQPFNKQGGMLGKPVAPSQGGQGEIRQSLVEIALEKSDVFREEFEVTKQKWPHMTEKSKNEQLLRLENILSQFQLSSLDELTDLNDNQLISMEEM